MNDWTAQLNRLTTNAAEAQDAIAQLTTMRDEMTSEIARYLRLSGGADIDRDAIAATIERPYTLIPIDEHEAWLIHWRGVRMPIVYGWVVSQEPAFIKARVTRSMEAIAPLPKWMKDELGWKPPEHQAVIDGTHTALRLIDGDEATFRKKYGGFLGQKQADGAYKIKNGDAWIKLVASLIRDGILPYQPRPVTPDHWNDKAISSIKLRNYQATAVNEFKTKGAVLINYPPGAGKSFIGAYILTHFIGRTLLLGDSTILVEQWRDMVKQYAPSADVTISTYQGAGKYLEREWDLVIFDETQRLPANTFSKLAFIKTKYRIGLSGTAWREDGRIHLIAALSGFPVHIPWAELIAAGVLQKPRVIVAIVPNDAAKARYVKQLVERRRGRALIYCDWLHEGAQIADALDAPFIHGSSANKLTSIRAAEVCVVSRVADRGIDLNDLSLVIEVGFMGGSREQYAQRLGRLLHSKFKGAFYTVFTEDEARQYRSRIFGAQAEMAGQVDVEFLYVDGAQQNQTPTAARRETRARISRTYAQRQSTPARLEAPRTEPNDEVAALMSIPGAAAKLNSAEKSVGNRTAPYVRRAFRICYSAAFDPKEIAEGLGITDAATVSRFRSACKALLNVGLFKDAGDGRYTVNRDEVDRLKALAGMVRK